MRSFIPHLKNIRSVLLACLIVIVPLSVNWQGLDTLVAHAGPTGWCTDYDGRNYRCDTGGGDTGYGGGGCATTSENSDAGIAASNSEASLDAGNFAWEADNFENAADLYTIAIKENPNNHTARGNLGEALYVLGLDAYEYGNYESAWLYFLRAEQYARSERVDVMEDSIARAESHISSYPDCSMCGKAIISDIGYGLGNSAVFLSYANQASANYKNCTNRISQSCSGSDGKWLFDQVYNCSQTFVGSDRGLHACIGHAWNSVK